MQPRLVLVHGSATDHTTWSIQMGSSQLRDRFDMVAPDRDFSLPSVEAHAAALPVGDRAILVGSSFGAVICLERLRTDPSHVAGAILIEPPMPPTDDTGELTAQRQFYEEFERRIAADGGPAAGEFFLQSVLGAEAYARIPRAFRERSRERWAAIRSDSAALVVYHPRYAELRTCTVPITLVGGARSTALFAPTLDALEAVLPDAERVVIPNAGHMLHAEAPRAFADLLIRFVGEVWNRDGIGA